MTWTTDLSELEAQQRSLAELRPRPWIPPSRTIFGGCFVCFGRGGGGPGAVGDRGWAAGVLLVGGRVYGVSHCEGVAGAPYVPGLLAAREGALLERAVRELPRRPHVLLVNATGRDHPRRAGLALHLGWVLDVPTVGVTHRPFVASGDPPGPEAGDASGLRFEGEQVGWWLRTRPETLPLAISAGWRTDIEVALRVVRGAVHGVRTPEPIRQARRIARSARSAQR